MKIFVCLPCCLLDFNCGLRTECYIEKELEQNPNQKMKKKNKNKKNVCITFSCDSRLEREGKRDSLKCVCV